MALASKEKLLQEAKAAIAKLNECVHKLHTEHDSKVSFTFESTVQTVGKDETQRNVKVPKLLASVVDTSTTDLNG